MGIVGVGANGFLRLAGRGGLGILQCGLGAGLHLFVASGRSASYACRLGRSASPCSLGLSATSQQYFSLTSNQPPATSQHYSSLRTNQHQPSATSQPNRLCFLPWKKEYDSNVPTGIQKMWYALLFLCLSILENNVARHFIENKLKSEPHGQWGSLREMFEILQGFKVKNSWRAPKRNFQKICELLANGKPMVTVLAIDLS
jgi:hypothetical protein